MTARLADKSSSPDLRFGPIDHAPVDRHPFIVVNRQETLSQMVAKAPAVLLYFSTPDCNVCRALQPKVGTLLDAEFPKMQAVYIDCAECPDIAASYGVFSVPTVLAYFEAREWVRKGRSLSLSELHEALARPYALLFGQDRTQPTSSRPPDRAH